MNLMAPAYYQASAILPDYAKKCKAYALHLDIIWWAMTGSNRRHPACKAGALPAELIARDGDPWGNRTPVIAVKGRCLNRLTNGPYLF